MEKETTKLLESTSTNTCWGLQRWFYGIKEYFDRCLCSAGYNFEQMDKSRAFIYKKENITSDCCCVWTCTSIVSFDNPLTGTLCLPLALTTHLLCLPVACLSCGRGDLSYGTTTAEEQEHEENWLKERNISVMDSLGMNLRFGVDDATHEKNCTTRGCTHPVHPVSHYINPENVYGTNEFWYRANQNAVIRNQEMSKSYIVPH